MRVEVAPEARRDIAAILRISERNFGKAARSRYRELIQAAFDDLRNDPYPAALSKPPALPRGLCLLHLRNVRPPRDVSNPRHYVAFRVVGETVQILRVVHDAMNVAERLQSY
jgi:toxin ParE1/3/4